MRELFTYTGLLLTSIFSRWVTSKWWIKCIELLAAAWLSIHSLHISIFGIGILMFIDILTGIPASKKKGVSFSSKIFRRGIIDKVIIYGLMFSVIFILEKMLHGVFDYGKYYGVMITSILIGTYEGSSITENLLVLRPNMEILNTIGKLIGVVRKETVKRTENALKSVSVNPMDKGE